MVFVAVNVGTIAYTRPEAGAAAGRVRGTFSRVPGAGMHRLLEQMRARGADGRLRVALWALTSTCLPRGDIRRALVEFGTIGYSCMQAHGKRGARRRFEVAGVMLCIDRERLRFLRLDGPGEVLPSTDEGEWFKGNAGRRVVRRARVMVNRVGVVGADNGDSDFLAVVAYPPTRMQSTGGKQTEHALEVDSVWRGLACAVLPEKASRVMVLGDLNAETPTALRRASRRTSASDAALGHLLDMAALVRLHTEGEWTYRQSNGERREPTLTEIDHVLLAGGIAADASEPVVTDGVETGNTRHRALEFVYTPRGVRDLSQITEHRTQQVRVCAADGTAAGRVKYEDCKRAYAASVAEAVNAERAVAGWQEAPAEAIVAVERATRSAMERVVNEQSGGRRQGGGGGGGANGGSSDGRDGGGSGGGGLYA